MPTVSTHSAQEMRFDIDIEPLGHPGGPTKPVPVYARSASAAARIAQQVFPRGEQRVRAVRLDSRIVWESQNHMTNNEQNIPW
jgi:hypothetical protein